MSNLWLKDFQWVVLIHTLDSGWVFYADFHFIWGKITIYEGLERQTDRKIGQTVTFDPASSSAANPAPLRRERELHSNTPN